ncbi:MAG TPA: hypothetical protein VMS71_03520, partial [Candidatus Acidoferrum sp.]|nr:hypothetical protein [Candidatus Acidoferrum sp.]
NFKLFRSLSLSGSYSTGSSNDKRYSPTNGELQTETRTFKKSWAITTRYSFTAPGGIAIPLFGKLKFSSVMTIDLSIRKNVNTGDSRTPGQPFVSNTDKSDFTVTPVIGYQFSQQLKGGLTALWQDTNDNWAKRKSHVRQLQIWAEIRF